MGKSKPQAPPTPDYQSAAIAQGQANQAAGLQSTSLSNPNVYTPYGSQTVNYAQTGPNGQWQPTVTQSLTPAAQQTLDAQQQVQLGEANLGQQALGTAQNVMSNPFQYNGPGIQTSLGNYGQASGNLDLSNVAKMPVNAGVTGQQAIMSRLQPQIDQSNAAFQQQMANQGITPGGEAFNNAYRNQVMGTNDLQSQAALYGLNLDMQANQQGFNEALQQGQFGNQAVAQNYNQALGAGQFANTAAGQALQQQLGLYNQPLNQISALMSGSQIQNPQFQQYTGTNIEAAPIANATNQLGQYQQGIYGQQMAGYNAGMQALGSAVGGLTGMINPISLSDVRLKSNIVRVGTHPLGIGIYDYDIFGQRTRGVMAHEVEMVRPEAVLMHPSGYKMVDYGALT